MTTRLSLADFIADLDCQLKKIGTCKGGIKAIWFCSTCGFSRFSAPRGERVVCAVQRALDQPAGQRR